MAIAQHAWLVLVVAVLLQVPVHWRRVRPQIENHPELEAGYRRLIRWSAFWMSLPWLVMGVGCELGGVPWFVNFLFPVTGGPFVWAFWVVVYSLFLLLGYWAVWGGGAEVLVRYPGIVNFRTDSARRMKRYLGGTAVLGLVWNTGFLVWLAS